MVQWTTSSAPEVSCTDEDRPLHSLRRSSLGTEPGTSYSSSTGPPPVRSVSPDPHVSGPCLFLDHLNHCPLQSPHPCLLQISLSELPTGRQWTYQTTGTPTPRENSGGTRTKRKTKRTQSGPSPVGISRIGKGVGRDLRRTGPAEGTNVGVEGRRVRRRDPSSFLDRDTPRSSPPSVRSPGLTPESNRWWWREYVGVGDGTRVDRVVSVRPVAGVVGLESFEEPRGVVLGSCMCRSRPVRTQMFGVG